MSDKNNSDESNPLIQFTQLVHQRRHAQGEAALLVEKRMARFVREHTDDESFVRRPETLKGLELARERGGLGTDSGRGM